MSSEEIEIQLWEYIDGTCSEADKARISGLIASNSTWSAHFKQLSAIHASIAGNMEQEQPSMRFTKNVMDTIAATHIAPATSKYINKGIIKGIAAFFIVTLTTILGYALATANYKTTSSPVLSAVTNTLSDAGSLFNGPVFNIIIGVNVVLLLLLLDTVLRKQKQAWK
ncbi:MAG: hypothetical protein JWQ38_3547 [Flavipsychrobacter sp.]|nr:hypothetical protein [Flavipsychrobacter sp.]